MQPCGVDYELKTYVGDTDQEKAHKRNSVRLAIRKLTYAADESAPQPRAEVSKDFVMSSGKLRAEASLDKEVSSILLLVIMSKQLVSETE